MILKIFLAAASLMLAGSGIAQNTIIVPPTQPEQKPEQATDTQSPAKPHKPARPIPPKPVFDAMLVCIDADGNLTAFTLPHWQAMPRADRQKYGKAGIDVRYGDQRFMLGMRDYPSVPLDYVGGQVPTTAQWKVIKSNRDAINKVLDEVGGDPIDDGSTFSYWHKGEKSDEPKAARLCAPSGEYFASVVMAPSAGDEYERVGVAVDGVSAAVCGERYGYVDADGRCVVPAQYEYLSSDGVACDNGLYGMIAHDGKVIVPFIYDGMISGRCLNVVYQDGLSGAFDHSGRLVIPIEYDEVVPSLAKPVAMARKGDRFALLDASERKITPDRYDCVVSAQEYGFAVGRDGLNLYLGIDGKEYGNADDMKIAILRKSTEPEDQYALAKLHYDHKNYFESIKYAMPAASAGYAPAQCLIGHFYANGRASASKSDSKAFEWYEKSARQGCDEGAYYLAKMYEEGRGTYRNPKLAAEWYAKSNGYADADERIQKLDPSQKPEKRTVTAKATVTVNTYVTRQSYCH